MTQPRCNICGRFGGFRYGRVWFPCVAWDDYLGGWEHA